MLYEGRKPLRSQVVHIAWANEHVSDSGYFQSDMWACGSNWSGLNGMYVPPDVPITCKKCLSALNKIKKLAEARGEKNYVLRV